MDKNCIMLMIMVLLFISDKPGNNLINPKWNNHRLIIILDIKLLEFKSKSKSISINKTINYLYTSFNN